MLTSPFFIAFFLLSIVTGLPLLAWIRLATRKVPDAERPYDASGLLPDLPSLPSLPGVPAGASEKAGDLIARLPWNK